MQTSVKLLQCAFTSSGLVMEGTQDQALRSGIDNDKH